MHCLQAASGQGTQCAVTTAGFRASSLGCTPSSKPQEHGATAGAASFQKKADSKISYIAFIVPWLQPLKVQTVFVFPGVSHAHRLGVQPVILALLLL